MKKTILFVALGILLVSITVMVMGCDNSGKPEYCSKSDCPAEAVGKSNYCSKHKCKNSSCENPNLGTVENISKYTIEEYEYCRACLARW